MNKSPNEIYKSAPLAHRKTMLAMRKIILEILPDAEEVVSYGMPAFKISGNVVAGLLHAKNHVGYYPFSGSILSNFSGELAKYSTTKSAIHVPINQPLPKSLITKLIKARISQCDIKNGRVDPGKYAKFDRVWKELGLAAPARRGLVDKKLFEISDLKKVTRDEFLKIHAIGPRAAATVVKEMKRKQISFKEVSKQRKS